MNRLHGDCFNDEITTDDVYDVKDSRSTGKSHFVVHLGANHGLTSGTQEYGRIRGLLQVFDVLEF